MNSMEFVELEKEYVIKVRRYIHQHPEISWQEKNTSKFICDELENMDINYEKICDTGVIGTIEGELEGMTIGLRADIDALPIQEETGLSFSSTNNGVMHACGHDGHVAILLTVAKILNHNKKNIRGKIKLIFQPAEEVVEGAKKMLVHNVLDGVDEIVALHLWNDIENGKIAVRSGAVMASTDHITIKIKGKGGHGAMPHQAVDSIVTASSIVVNLQTIVSRKINPLEPVVISIGSFHAGEMNNVIAHEAVLKGTVRCFNEELRQELPSMIENVVANISNSFGADYEILYDQAASVTVNNKQVSDKMKKAVCKAFGEESLITIPPITGSEDFSEFLREKPGCIAFVGSKKCIEGVSYPHHHPKFDIEERSLMNGVRLLLEYVNLNK